MMSRRAPRKAPGCVRRTMKRFILTGAPGSGKTSILRVLAATGYAVVEEVATDVNVARLAAGDTQPWTDPVFIERIAVLQRQRREEPVGPEPRHRCTTG